MGGAMGLGQLGCCWGCPPDESLAGTLALTYCFTVDYQCKGEWEACRGLLASRGIRGVDLVRGSR